MTGYTPQDVPSYPGSADEVYNYGFGMWRWDVAKAWRLLRKGTLKAEVQTVGIVSYAEGKLGLLRQRPDWQNPASHVAIDMYHAQHLAPEWLDIPGLVIATDQGAIVIDGNHRLARRYWDGLDTMDFYVIKAGDDRPFRLDSRRAIWKEFR